MFELPKIMRQQDCIPFAELFNRLREGNQTPNDFISSDSENYPISAQYLFKTNDKVDSYNKFLFDMSSFDIYIYIYIL